jgi:hypothetical protein
MDTVLLVFASLAALVFGVLSAYGACVMLFGLVRIQTPPKVDAAPGNVASQPVSV